MARRLTPRHSHCGLAAIGADIAWGDTRDIAGNHPGRAEPEIPVAAIVLNRPESRPSVAESRQAIGDSASDSRGRREAKKGQG